MKKNKFLEECKKIIFKNIEIFQTLENYDKTGKLYKLNFKKRVDITLDRDILNKFREFCRKSGFKISNRIEQLIVKDLYIKN